jgi:hypothetical protein
MYIPRYEGVCGRALLLISTCNNLRYATARELVTAAVAMLPYTSIFIFAHEKDGN